MSLYDFCRGIPKIELHCHLFGTIRKQTFIDFNIDANRPILDKDIEEFYTRGEKPIGVLRILRAMDKYLITTPQHLYRLVIEYLEDASAHNVIYSEFFWNPTGTVHELGIKYEDAQNAIAMAMEQAEINFGIQSNLICSIDREVDAKFATEMVQWMYKFKHPKVVGIGIDYLESKGPPMLFEEAYSLAKKYGFKLTAHAGEFGCPASYISAAINDLKVDRIDHGYTVLDDEKLLQQCIDKNIIFTVVPSNSYYLRTLPKDEWASKHPIRFMARRGLRIFPNTDDPIFHQVTPTDSWKMMVDCFDYTVDDLKSFVLNSIEAAWVSEDLKNEWRNQLPKYFEDHCT